ncbi:MAG: cobalamin-binding protein [Planctomycetes bacterium]|nr:cobalamin-binding protein [Planctomycetota bacterium]MBM4087158.1 cobalamin-binding protein [Planctomycetota bacterium]
MADLKALAESVINGKRDQATKLTEQAINEGVPVKKILNEGLIAGMGVVGDRFKKNEFYVPEVLIAARAMNAAMTILEPHLAKAGVEPLAKVVIGTVKGDLHDIGKNLVAMMLKGGGFKVIDKGIDVAPEEYVKTAQAEGAKLVGLSALLTTTMPQMENVVKALKEAGLKGQVKVIIGGAPVTQSYADEIGADGYAPDAASAVDKAKQLLGV